MHIIVIYRHICIYIIQVQLVKTFIYQLLSILMYNVWFMAPPKDVCGYCHMA